MLLQKAFCCTKPPCSTVKPGHHSAGPIATTHGLRSVGSAPVVHLHQLRQVRTSAAGRDPEPAEPIDYPVTADVTRSSVDYPVSPDAAASRSSNSRSNSRSTESPIRDASFAAADAVEDAGDAAANAVEQAAETATGAISDAADVAQAAVTDAQEAAAAAVLDASDAAAAVADDVSHAASDAYNRASDIASDVVDTLGGGSDPPVVFSTAGQLLDQRFEGMKVLVTGATGGVGRRVVQALRAKGVACRALVRDTARAANLLPPPSSSSSSGGGAAGPEFDVVKGDVYQYSTLPAAIKGCNAVVVCTAANDKSDPFGPFNIDYQGTLNLIAAAKRHNVKRFVFVTSIGADDPFNPLNLFWGILFWKKRAEEELQRSGLSYTIVRPGGLKNKLSAGESEGSIVMEGPDSFGFPPFKKSGAILRSQVADVCVEALVCPAAADKVVEIIAERSAPAYPLQQLFERI